jgi:hypothetical protein
MIIQILKIIKKIIGNGINNGISIECQLNESINEQSIKIIEDMDNLSLETFVNVPYNDVPGKATDCPMKTLFSCSPIYVMALVNSSL